MNRSAVYRLGSLAATVGQLAGTVPGAPIAWFMGNGQVRMEHGTFQEPQLAAAIANRQQCSARTCVFLSPVTILPKRGAGHSSQTTRFLGTFSGTDSGWQTWQWVPLLNADGQMAVVPLEGVKTLKMTAGGGLNASFYKFVPVPAHPTLAVSFSNASSVLSFSTQTNFTYWVVYKNNLTESLWKLLAVVSGNGSTQTFADLPGATTRFYAIAAQ